MFVCERERDTVNEMPVYFDWFSVYFESLSSSGDCFSSLVCLFVCFLLLGTHTVYTLLLHSISFERRENRDFLLTMLCIELTLLVFHIETTATCMYMFSYEHAGEYTTYTYTYILLCTIMPENETQFTCAWISNTHAMNVLATLLKEASSSIRVNVH